jgi:hypothetical protein
MINKTIDDHVEVHCSIPLHPSKVIGCQEYWAALKESRNKGQRLRVMSRVLSSMGYHANCPDDVRKIVREFLEDYDG